MKLSVSVVQNDGWYVGSIKEFPAVNTQGRTLEELEENLLDALQLYLECEQDERKKS